MTFEELKQKQTEIFIADRTKNETQVKLYMEVYSKLPATIKSKFPLDETLTYQKLCPEAYKENPDAVIYNQQHEAAIAMFGPINQFAAENNKKVEALLQRAQQEL